MLRMPVNKMLISLVAACVCISMIIAPETGEAKKKKGKGKKAKAAEVEAKTEKKESDADSGDILGIGGGGDKEETSETTTSGEAASSESDKDDASAAGKDDASTESADESSVAKDDAPEKEATADKEETETKAEGKDVDMVIDTDEVGDDAAVETSPEGESKSGGGILATEFDGMNVAKRDRGVNILTARAARKGSLTLIIDHRPFKNLFSGDDAFFDYLGLDRGETLKVGLGLRYGIIDGLDFGIYRLNDGGNVLYDTYEFDLRYAFLNQDKHFVNLMVRAGLSWFTFDDAKDAVGFFGQMFVDHIFLKTLLVGVGFAFHSESSSEYKLDKDDAYSGAVTAVVEWRALDWFAVTAELAAPVLGYKQDYPVGTFALKFLTHRHTFSLMLSNTQFINADGIVAGAWRGMKDLIFGFQIFREFNIAEY